MISRLDRLQGRDIYENTALAKINELVDAVNKLETMAKNTNTVLESLVQENNFHEMQIDELQMKLEAEKCVTGTTADKLLDPTPSMLEEVLENIKKEEERKTLKALTLDYDDTDDIAEVKNENLYTKSMRMDKEFTEEECKRLQTKLDRTRKALGYAIDVIQTVAKMSDKLSREYGETLVEQLDNIQAYCWQESYVLTHEEDLSKALEQKDVK